MIEPALWAGVATYLASRWPLRDLADVLPLGYRLIPIAFVGLMLAGQLVDDRKRSWPFVRSNVYSERVRGTRGVHRHRMLRASGGACLSQVDEATSWVKPG